VFKCTGQNEQVLHSYYSQGLTIQRYWGSTEHKQKVHLQSPFSITCSDFKSQVDFWKGKQLLMTRAFFKFKIMADGPAFLSNVTYAF
jgi:hypothetical protein